MAERKYKLWDGTAFTCDPIGKIVEDGTTLRWRIVAITEGPLVLCESTETDAIRIHCRADDLRVVTSSDPEDTHAQGGDPCDPDTPTST